MARNENNMTLKQKTCDEIKQILHDGHKTTKARPIFNSSIFTAVKKIKLF